MALTSLGIDGESCIHCQVDEVLNGVSVDLGRIVSQHAQLATSAVGDFGETAIEHRCVAQDGHHIVDLHVVVAYK